jgi:hypothetical protein
MRILPKLVFPFVFPLFLSVATFAQEPIRTLIRIRIRRRQSRPRDRSAAESRFGGEEFLQTKIVRGQIVFQFRDAISHIRPTIVIAPNLFWRQREATDHLTRHDYTFGLGVNREFQRIESRVLTFPLSITSPNR